MQHHFARVRLRLLLAAAGLAVVCTIGPQLLLYTCVFVAVEVRSIFAEPPQPGEQVFLGAGSVAPSWRASSTMIINLVCRVGLLIPGCILVYSRSGLSNFIVRRIFR